GPLAVAVAADRVRQAALGLAHAHEQRLAHGTLTPRHLLLGPDEDGWPTVVKVRDLGLAGLRPGDPSADFPAPEALLKRGEAGPAADLYGLGAVLYFLLTGRAPYGEASRGELMLRGQRGMPTPVRSLRPDVPAGLAGVIEQCLSHWPEARPGGAAEVARLLAPYSGAAPPPVPPGRPVRPVERLEVVED